MISFKQFLSEAFQYKWHEVPGGINIHKKYAFETENGFDYKVLFFGRDVTFKKIEMSWGRDSMSRMTNDNPRGYDSEDAIRIISTVIEITNKYLEKYKPYSLYIPHVDMRRFRIFDKKFKPRGYEVDDSDKVYPSTTLYVRK